MNNFLPDKYVKNIWDIDIKKLKKENIKYMFLDVDNTLLTYKDNLPSKKSIDFIKKIKSENITCFLFSNSNSDRIDAIKNKFNVEAYTSCAKPLKKNYKRVLKKYKKNECIFVGDQIMTDVFGAKRNGFKVILVDGFKGEEPLTTKFWRFLERIVLKRLKKKNNFEKGKYYE